MLIICIKIKLNLTLTIILLLDVWCEDIVLGSELQLLRNSEDDHLVLAFDQGGRHGSKLTVYFACIGKGQLNMPTSLRALKHKMKHSKVKMYHPGDIELMVHSKRTADEVLESLECPVERMQAQEAPPSSENEIYSYSRGDIPMFNFDEADRLLIATLQELIEVNTDHCVLLLNFIIRH